MRRIALLLLAAALAPPADATECPAPEDVSKMVGTTAITNCLVALNAMKGEVAKLRASGTRDQAELSELVVRYDALLARAEAVKAALPRTYDPNLERSMRTIFNKTLADMKDPAVWDGFKVPAPGTEPKAQAGGAAPADVSEVPAPAPTPEKQEEARQRAADSEAALPEQPSPAEAVSVAKDFLRGADPEGAVRVLEQAGEDGGGDSTLLNVRSAARYQTRDWSGAYTDAQRALALDPEDVRAAELAGAARMMLRRLGLKEPRLTAPKRPEEAGAVAETEGSAWGGAALPSAGRREAAAQFWASGQSKLRIGDRRGALLDLARVLERDPRHLGALVQRANLLNHGPKPDHAAALAEAEKALAVGPADPGALRERAYALVGLGRYAEALAAAEEALRAEPDSALGHLYRAMALDGLGRRDEALAEFNRAADLDATLREYYEEALNGAREPKGRKAPPSLRVPPGALRAGLLLLGLGLALWGLWKGLRLASGWTTRGTGSPEPERAPADTLAPGTLLGGLYRVGGVLGRGGMGVVYEAVDIGLERAVAVKELRAPDAEAELFLREARSVAALQHPGIVQIHSLTEHDGRLYMVFERVHGRSLDAELAERGRLASEAVRALLRDVCPALDHAHGAKVIHRDLKPGNLMRAADGRCKVMDFGIAHRASLTAAATRTEAWGTPPYMAPEQEEGSVSRESDLYALGCTVYELLAGARPFSGGADKRARRFRPLSELGLPAALDAFMARALDPDPAARFHSAADFLSAFEGALTDRIAA